MKNNIVRIFIFMQIKLIFIRNGLACFDREAKDHSEMAYYLTIGLILHWKEIENGSLVLQW